MRRFFRFFSRLWDVRVIFSVLIVAVLLKRPALARRDTVRLLRAVESLNGRLSSLESRIDLVERSPMPAAAPVARSGDGLPPRDREKDRPVISAPPDWRFAVVRGEPCVLFGSGYSYMIRAGHITRFGRILVIGPESVLTDRYIVVFGKGFEDGTGTV